ncbi:nitrate reductase molybdenum cofactor assembly chaperone [Nocardia acidivorans]|uniref:nitrate reductase molybdenum cofactor assembly chaperone n=1 Tax=Nocardia acidivorans TaxID=404580 RepID=UPI000AE0D196|nr:nitrate reductase molybdenum cofactor assembly chaperone [Nocardia acidivorans]
MARKTGPALAGELTEMKLTDSVRCGAWQLQSVLLAYPDDALLDSLSLLCRTAAALPEPIGAPLQPLLNHLERGAPLALVTEFVETFDHRKRFSPYLTWFLYGDTRKRDMALLRFKQLYRASGPVLDDGELSDHLAMVLEFAAAFPLQGEQLLLKHRTQIEAMRMTLRENGSPWTGVLESLSATLPPLRGEQSTAMAQLIAQGPPGSARRCTAL